jgi:hypothetical protein
MLLEISSVGNHRAVEYQSQPVIGRKTFRKIYQDIPLDESNIKFLIRSRPKKFQPVRLIPVETVFGSQSDVFFWV